jgi:nucleotide-binding universal stress UspA family protein
MLRSLLVALGGTPFGEHALPLAVSLARRTGAELHLVHVNVPTIENGEIIAQRNQAYLDEMTRRINAHAPEVRVTTSEVEGAEVDCVADALVRHIETKPVDLIILNSHARGGLSRWWMGSVADDLVHRTSIPLLVTPALEHDPAWETDLIPRHILVPLDGTPLAEQVLPTALTFGASVGAEYTLLRVVEPVPVPVVDPVCAPAAAFDPSLIDELQATAETYLTRIAARLRGNDAHLVLHTYVVLDPEPAEAICGFLSRRAASSGRAVSADRGSPVDMVALATHGREGLTRLLLGSVADRVLQHTPVPLLLQRSSGKEQEPSRSLRT